MMTGFFSTCEVVLVSEATAILPPPEYEPNFFPILAATEGSMSSPTTPLMPETETIGKKILFAELVESIALFFPAWIVI